MNCFPFSYGAVFFAGEWILRMIDDLQGWQTPCATSLMCNSCFPHAQQKKMSSALSSLIICLQSKQIRCDISSTASSCLPQDQQKNRLFSSISSNPSNFIGIHSKRFLVSFCIESCFIYKRFSYREVLFFTDPLFSDKPGDILLRGDIKSRVFYRHPLRHDCFPRDLG